MKRYEKQFQESMISINNINNAMMAITEGISFIYDRFGNDLKADKLVASGIFTALKDIENADIKASMMMINKYVRDYANKQFLGKED